MTYFPELVAGPIVPGSVFLPQVHRSIKCSAKRLALGLEIILQGVTKKLLIAERLAGFSDVIFANPARFSSLTNSLAVIAYSLQIYCDFSGYSDIAIGVSKIIRFHLPENFNMSYLSTYPHQFLKRPHITLITRLRDYLYHPLSASLHGTVRTSLQPLFTLF